MERDAIMFMLQGGLSVIMLLFGFVLNGMRSSMDRVSLDLKLLNDAVLGKYVTSDALNARLKDLRDDQDARSREQRVLDHELRSLIQKALVEVAGITGKPYTGKCE